MGSAVAQTKPNRLAGENSPYLGLAVRLPVNWYSWGKDPFRRAAELNVPILLDVDAVWCPWCDLMDRDTYSKNDTAAYINQRFVSVKIDFDASRLWLTQLQRAQAVLSRPAGMPLTSFITPHGKLYFGAGYLLAQHRKAESSFRETADEALPALRITANRRRVSSIAGRRTVMEGILLYSFLIFCKPITQAPASMAFEHG